MSDVLPIRVIFVCTHNSARSIMAEALLRTKGGAHFDVYSAGTHAGAIRPLTLRVITNAGLSTEGLRAKSVDELIDAPFDYVVTVCDDAQEECPTFPGGRQRLHWSYPDPAAVSGSETQRLEAFRQVFEAIDKRIGAFIHDATVGAS